MPKVPLLAGTRVAVVNAPDDSIVLRPPAPAEGVADVAAAVRDALRFPLAGEPLARLVPKGGRATVVVEPPALPIPGASDDPRQDAIAATVDELVEAGIPHENQTILVAGGLARRPGKRDVEALVSPDFARRFHGEVTVHDVEDPGLVPVGSLDGVPLRANRALVETDVVVTVTAAETVLHGGPAALLAAANPEALRAAQTESLLETTGSLGWDLAVALERALAQRVAVAGVSLALTMPRLGGALRGYPYDEDALARVTARPLRFLYGAVPAVIRARVLRSLPLELGVAAVFAGPPSVAHAEALIRNVEARSADLAEPLDAICIGIPRATLHLPRERPNPLAAAHLGLALALRLWRDAFPVAEGGTAILVHRFHRKFAHPTQGPYRAFFHALRGTGAPEELRAAEQAVVADERALEGYRSGRSCHPLLPFADWAACVPALSRLGSVMIAGCRDAVAARQLGFVPTHGIGAALAMAHGRAGGPPRIGFLLSPPYYPVTVGVNGLRAT